VTYLAEKHSEHPLAKAVAKKMETVLSQEQMETLGKKYEC